MIPESPLTPLTPNSESSRPNSAEGSVEFRTPEESEDTARALPLRKSPVVDTSVNKVSNSRLETAPGTVTPAFLDLVKRLLVASAAQRVKMSQKTEKDLPLYGSRDAPVFRGAQDAKYLQRYIELVKELLKNHSVTDDDKKKKWLGRYADPHTQKEWEGLPSFTDVGRTFEDHIEEVLDSYWETRDRNEGSLAKLDKLVGEYQGLTLNKQKETFDFIRSFRAIMNPLVAQGTLSNKGLVDKFLSALAPNFRTSLEISLESSIAWKGRALEQEMRIARLEGQAAGAQGAPAAPVKKRVADDKFLIEEVIQQAMEMIESRIQGNALMESDQGRASEYTRKNTPMTDQSRTKVKVEELGSQMESLAAFMKDQMVIQEKREKSHRDEMRQLTDLIRNQGSTGQGWNSGNSGRGRSDYNQYSQAPRSSEPCFYCGEHGHMQGECEHRQRHLREGLVIMEGNSIRLPNGAWLPKAPIGEPRKPLKARVEEFYANKKESVQSNQYVRYALEEEEESTYGSYIVKEMPARDGSKMSRDNWEEFLAYQEFKKVRSGLVEGESTDSTPSF